LQLSGVEGMSRSSHAARGRSKDQPGHGKQHGLGKSIYTKEQLEEFAWFQDSQGTRKAYLAETAEMAYIGRNEKGDWGLVNFFPLCRVVGPMVFFLSLLLLVWGGLRLVVTIFLRVAIITRYKGCGIWVLTAFCSSWRSPHLTGLTQRCRMWGGR
jgi:hypothetical protein